MQDADAGMTGLWSTLAATTAVIGHAKIGFVAGAFAVDTLSLVLMACRWRLLLHSVGSGASLWETLLAYAGGVCVCNITPARTIGGDACRAALIRRPDSVPPMKAIAASVIYDRMTDGAGFLLLGLIALPALKTRTPHWGWLALIAIVIALTARPLYRRLATRVGRWHEAAIGRAMTGSVTAAVGCSLVIWLLDITRIILLGRAFDVRFAPSQAAAVSLLRLGSGLVPVPAGLGVVDGALVAGFMWLGVPTTTAAALAIMERAIVYVWATALGAVALLLLGGTRALRKARGASPLMANS